MRDFKNLVLTAAISAVAVGLTGCSGEPSGAEIEALLRASLAGTTKQMEGVVGAQAAKNMSGEIYSVESLGCVDREPAGYICDVEVDMKAPFSGRNKSVAKVALVEGDDGWKLVQ
ncbi:hypothetical protein [Pseudomonas sp. 2FG]|uniref:hypothetical protein n=1 Tax=Pseudomonas sp. 2FG TaxID=2502191 RepID=UPI0010F99AEC|nr:hypothetical protein [Pseudomonas sp. 2FG]